jgi:hypothetical protein
MHQTNLDLYLPLVLFAYRASQQTTTGSSPFELLYGREVRLPSDFENFDKVNYRWIEAKREIVKRAEINKCQYDSKYRKDQVNYKVDE